MAKFLKVHSCACKNGLHEPNHAPFGCDLSSFCEVSKFTHYKDRKGDAKCRNWGCLWLRNLSRSSPTRFDRADTTFCSTFIQTKHLSCTVIASNLSNVADLNLPHLHLAPVGDDRRNFADIFGVRKLKSPLVIVWRCLRDVLVGGGLLGKAESKIYSPVGKFAERAK